MESLGERFPAITSEGQSSLASAVRGVYFGGSMSTSVGSRDFTRHTEFVPLQPGLNVVYGLNGAGKSRFLRRLQSMIDGEGGPGEGLLLDPLTVLASQPWARDAWDAGQSDLWSGLAAGLVGQLGGEWSVPRNGTIGMYDQAGEGDVENGDVINAKMPIDQSSQDLLADFLCHGYLLWTRRYLAPRHEGILVPFLPPYVRGPLAKDQTRAMRGGVLRRAREVARLSRATRIAEDRGDRRADELFFAESNEAYRQTDEWVEEWRASPLLNSRNFLWDDYDSDDIPSMAVWIAMHAVADENLGAFTAAGQIDCMRFLGDELPLYLPPIGRYVVHLEDQPRDVGFKSHRESSNHSERLEQATTATHKFLAERIGRPSKDVELSAGVNDVNELSDAVTKLQDGAQSAYRKWLPGTQPLRLDCSSLWGLVSGREPSWGFGEGNSYGYTEGSDLASGSSAQQRWACLSISWAADSDLQFVLLDEPEAGLHRTAESAIGRELATKTVFGDAVVVTATHSLDFLNQPDAHLLYARAYEPIRPMTEEARRFPDLLGVRPSDLLARTRIILLVEGLHDVAVLQTLMGDFLERLGVHILALRGAKNAEASLDSQFLFDFTDATMVVLLDNLNADRIREVWSSARNLAQTGESAAAWKKVEDALPGSTGEERFLREFMSRALDSGRHERVDVFALEEADIIYYLPARNFVGNKTWEQVKSEYEIHRAQRGKTKRLKDWIAGQHGTDAMSKSAYENAAAELTVLPADFVELHSFLEKIAAGSET